MTFNPDPFQRQACDAIDDDASVLVAAPTGSGKTFIAEHAIKKALAEKRRAFSLCPIRNSATFRSNSVSRM